MQIFKIDGTKSHCYLVDSGDVKIVDTAVLRPQRFPTPKRHEFLNMEFFFDGAPDLASGRWKVRRIVDNEFVCTRLTGGGVNPKNLENFDIGYVMSEVINQHELRSGPSRRSTWSR